MGAVLFAALLVHVGAHLAIVVAFARARDWKRAALAFFLPPLAPHWAWRAGMKKRVWIWAGALAAYALGVAAA